MLKKPFKMFKYLAKHHKTLLFWATFGYSIGIYAQETQQDSLVFSIDTIDLKKTVTEEVMKQNLSYISLGFIGSGILIKAQKNDYRSLRHYFTPTYRESWDNYTQYMPLIGTWTLKASGVEGRSTWGGLALSNALSLGIMAAITNGLKYTIKEQRPDYTSRNSFPSGHTAFAFATATILHKEYGKTRNLLYSLGGYSLATATGIGRVLNNRHWVSDVLVGAGIGIISTDVGYFLSDLILKGKGTQRKLLAIKNFDISQHSSFLSIGVEVCSSPTKVSVEGLSEVNNNTLDISSQPLNLNFHLGMGSAVKLEGAYFLNKYLGFGGSLKALTIPVTAKVNSPKGFSYYEESTDNMIQSLQRNVEFIGVQSKHAGFFEYHAGLYLSYPLSSKVSLGSNFTIGQRFMVDYEVDALLRVNTSSLQRDAQLAPIGSNSFFKTQKSKDLFMQQLSEVKSENEHHTSKFIVLKTKPSVVWGTGLSCTWAQSNNIAFRFTLNYNYFSANYSYDIRNRWATNGDGVIETFTDNCRTKLNLGTISLGLGMSLLF